MLTGLLALAATLSPRPAGSVQVSAACGPGLSQRDTVAAFYQLLDARSYAAAFACYSRRRQAQTSYTAWQRGYSTSLHSRLLTAQLLPLARVAFSLLATDGKDGHRVYSRFSGTWTLVQEHGWRLDLASVRLDSRNEGPSLVFPDALLTQVQRTSGGMRMRLPALVPLPVKQFAWQIAAISGGIAITLAAGTPIADANTVFTETVARQTSGAGPADKRVTLLDGSHARYYEPFAHGGNGQPSLSWSSAGLSFELSYACSSGCLGGLEQMANSMQAFPNSVS